MSRRENKVEVMVNDEELAELDELRGGRPRAAFIRSLLRGIPENADVASRAEALSILTGLAREGRTTAAIALARELREEGNTDERYIFGN